MTDRQKPNRPEVTGHLSPARYAEALEQYVEELDAYYGNLLRRAVEALAKMHGVNRHLIAQCDMCSLIAEIREHLGEEA